LPSVFHVIHLPVLLCVRESALSQALMMFCNSGSACSRIPYSSHQRCLWPGLWSRNANFRHWLQGSEILTPAPTFKTF